MVVVEQGVFLTRGIGTPAYEELGLLLGKPQEVWGNAVCPPNLLVAEVRPNVRAPEETPPITPGLYMLGIL